MEGAPPSWEVSYEAQQCSPSLSSHFPPVPGALHPPEEIFWGCWDPLLTISYIYLRLGPKANV
jgi:hypothetical protein